MEVLPIANCFATREFLWVIKVINSCKHPEQLHICLAIIDLFKKNESDKDIQLKLDEAFQNKAVKLKYNEYIESEKHKNSFN